MVKNPGIAVEILSMIVVLEIIFSFFLAAIVPFPVSIMVWIASGQFSSSLKTIDLPMP